MPNTDPLFKSQPTDLNFYPPTQLEDQPVSDASQHNFPLTSIGVYFQHLQNLPRLTDQEEINIFIAIEKDQAKIDKNNGEDNYYSDLLQKRISFAKRRIIESNLRLAIHIAKKYQNRGLDFEDLIQEANIGLMNAVGRFDWRRGVRFGAFASWWIQQAIGHSIANHSRAIRLPIHAINSLKKICRAKNQANTDNVDQISKLSGISAEKIRTLTAFSFDPISLDEPISADHQNSLTVQDTFADPNAEDPLLPIMIDERNKLLETSLGLLNERDRNVIELRYGLHDGQERSLREIGDLLNLSRERVRQLEARGLKILRQNELIDHGIS